MAWTIIISRKAKKNLDKLPKKVTFILQMLVDDLSYKGVNPGKKWHHLGKLSSTKSRTLWHCHLIRGNPTYVCCWELIDKVNKVIEVYYVGTHEKAPY